MSTNKIFRIVLLSLGALILIFLGWKQLANEEDTSPCSPTRYPARCYRVSREVCETTWAKSEPECKEKIRQLNLAPTRLLSPIEFKCQVLSLDRLVNYMRIHNEDCDKLHKELEAWKLTNPDF